MSKKTTRRQIPLTDKKFLRKNFFYFLLIFAYFLLVKYLGGYFHPFESTIGIFTNLSLSLIKFVSLLYLLIYFFRFFSTRNEKNKRLLIRTFLLVVWVFISSFVSTKLANQFFPDYLTKINKEINQEKIDVDLPQEEIQQIRELAKTLNQEGILRIYDCQEEDPWQNSPSKLCQKGDIVLKLGYSINCGRLCGRGAFHYYLLRKINGSWQVIEDLGESSFISENTFNTSPG